jgi:predicted nucleic acid-binding protein
MKKLKVYLDTSVINFLFADDSPPFKSMTEEFFSNFIKKNIYDVYVSDVVLDEILRTENESKKLKLLQVIQEYELPYEVFNQEAARLAEIYVAEGIIPKRKYDDARHIGLATVKSFDILLSWNFKHLSNINKRNKVKIINEKEGFFYPLDLVTPIQLMYEND